VTPPASARWRCLTARHYIINGAKQWITNGSFADVIVLLASTNPKKGIMGITAFIVPVGTPGFALGGVEDTMEFAAASRRC
jgi:butyryl-CoA dehydrogenase